MIRLGSRLPPGLDAAALEEFPFAPGVIDLCATNPTQVGLDLGASGPHACAIDPLYSPTPLGPVAARRSIATMLTGMGRETCSQDVVLAAGTSEALSYVFKVFCAPGDTVVTSRPGYPLIEHLAELEGLRVVACASDYARGGWQLDMHAVSQALAQGARMVVLVSPNNPTGARLRENELTELAALCRQHGAVFVLDEVFAAFGAQAPSGRLAQLAGFELAISLGGLSKAGLWPQLKLSWLALHGEGASVMQARVGLEWVADAYLSVSQPVADAVPQLIEALAARQARMLARLSTNMAALCRLVPQGDAPPASYSAKGWGCVLPREAGWSAIVVLAQDHPVLAEAGRQGLTLAQALLDATQVATLPAAVFDLAWPHAVVTSLIVPEARFAAGWSRLAAHRAHW